MIKHDKSLLEAALVGYNHELARLQNIIAGIQARLGVKGGARAAATVTRRKRKPMSAASRKRIAAAQKRRWADYRKKKGAPA